MPITLTLATVPRPGTRPGRRRALPSREGVRMVVTVVVIVVMITVSVAVRVIGVPRSGGAPQAGWISTTLDQRGGGGRSRHGRAA